MTTEATSPSRSGQLLRRWPALLGLAAAAFSAYGMTSGVDQATVLVAATVIYLGAAVLGKQTTAWPLFFGAIVVITAIRLINDDFQPSWILFGFGAIFLVYGLARRMFEPTWGLPLQTIALLVLGGLAAIGLLISPTIGAYLVALGLLGHASLDVWLFRTNRVVARSMAEFCFVLDATLAVLIVVLTNVN
jgi:hypothetical protein